MFVTHVLRSVTEGRFFCDIVSDVTKEPSLCYTSEHMGDEHRGGLLHVVATGVEKRIEGELRTALQIKALGTPRNTAGTVLL
jgi:hypothetical protein